MATAKIIQNLSVLDFNAITNKTTVRDMSQDEILDLQARQAESLAREAEATAKADARISALAKLAKLGLTQAEIEAL